MNHTELYQSLKNHYLSINPHHDTWVLWTKDNKTTEETFEVAIGTILVQNTNWKNVDKAVENLRKNSVFSFDKIIQCEDDRLIELIKPVGFFNQKSVYLKAISRVFMDNDEKTINRELLLKTKGIGKETADSILNFCLRRPVPVIGTYTKRFFARLTGDIKFLSKNYEIIQQEILSSFLNPSAYELGLYHAQNVCTKKNPTCSKCFLKSSCRYFESKNNKFDIHILLDEKISPMKKK